MPNWKEFDGVLILKDSIQTPHVASEIEKRLKNEYEGEVLVIDLESEFFPSVITDGYKPIYDVVSHLIEHHDFLYRQKYYRIRCRDAMHCVSTKRIS